MGLQTDRVYRVTGMPPIAERRQRYVTSSGSSCTMGEPLWFLKRGCVKGNY